MSFLSGLSNLLRPFASSEDEAKRAADRANAVASIRKTIDDLGSKANSDTLALARAGHRNREAISALNTRGLEAGALERAFAAPAATVAAGAPSQPFKRVAELTFKAAHGDEKAKAEELAAQLKPRRRVVASKQLPGCPKAQAPEAHAIADFLREARDAAEAIRKPDLKANPGGARRHRASGCARLPLRAPLLSTDRITHAAFYTRARVLASVLLFHACPPPVSPPALRLAAAESHLAVVSAPARLLVGGTEGGTFQLLFFPFTRHVYAVPVDGTTSEEIMGAPVYCVGGDPAHELHFPVLELPADALGRPTPGGADH